METYTLEQNPLSGRKRDYISGSSDSLPGGKGLTYNAIQYLSLEANTANRVSLRLFGLFVETWDQEGDEKEEVMCVDVDVLTCYLIFT